MTFFEQELHKLFDRNEVLSDVRIVGNTCYGRLTDSIRVKASFQTGMIANQYDRLKVTLLNRNEGTIGSLVVRFKDLWGIKATDNPNFREGVSPHIWDGYGKACWYVYQPRKADYQRLAEAVDTYLSVFQEPAQERQMGQKMG